MRPLISHWDLDRPSQSSCGPANAVWWDLKRATPAQLRKALNLCCACPLLDFCRDETAALISAGAPPMEQIRAAAFYNEHGRRIDGGSYLYPRGGRRQAAADASTTPRSAA